MFKFVIASALSLALASPALADNGHHNNDGVSGALAIAGISFENTSAGEFSVRSSVEGSSASGVQADFDLRNSAVAAFGSFGVAGSTTEVSPFTVNTTSGHLASFSGFTQGQAILNGNTSTFAQSEGKGKFEAEASHYTSVEGGALFAAFSFDD